MLLSGISASRALIRTGVPFVYASNLCGIRFITLDKIYLDAKCNT